ncbi:signal peptidase I [Actinomadura coerulea]|uniref:signal peptidase I n=1 Tax=Actinomadura coerulea TaxID=46159 RepID=A0A7X0FZ26_9ACTN|nr:signal peptidase I [Actinomadura coerulea]GGQ25814.1 S26 family signal peptidase [Actinomadura coerulea]
MIRAALAAGALTAAGLVLAARRGLLLTTVDGTSMEPALSSGDRILVRRTRRVRRGQVALLRPPGRPSTTLLLKRAVAVPGDHVPGGWADPDVARIGGAPVPPRTLVVLGDNRPASWDSRHYGYVPRHRVVGVMLCRLSGH